MISALDLKNKLESFDKNTPLLNYNVLFGFLPAIILFPLYLILSTTRTESAIIHSPIMFGAGLFGFFIMSLVFSTGSLLIIYLALGRYIAAKDTVRRFNVNGILQDDFIIRKMAKGLDVFLFNRLWSRFMLLIDWIFEEIKQGLRYEISQTNIRVDKVEKESFTREQELNFAFQQQGKQNKELFIENQKLRKENYKLKQSRVIISDLSSKAVFKQKVIDKLQSTLDPFL